jgi:hypothetical protein
VSEISQTPQHNIEQDLLSEDDGKIMAYLEKSDVEKPEEVGKLRAIDLALNNFMGEFNELKSEIQSLKESTLRKSDAKYIS